MPSESYRAAGVDIDAGEEAVRRIRPHVMSTTRPEVLGGIGGFGALFALEPAKYDDPVLVSSTDGVGTKAMVATATARFDTVGIDLVAMCVDDIACQGAEPLWFLDYIAVGHLDPEQVERLVAGVADGCRQAGCALIGGEMAEHPGAMEKGEFDLVGFAVGVVERARLVTPDLMRGGRCALRAPVPGAAVERLLARTPRAPRGRRTTPRRSRVEGAPHSLADELLLPSVIYAPAILALATQRQPHGIAHVTGGGLPGNVPRMLPDGLDAVIHRSTWEVPPIFGEIERVGRVVEAEMQRVFNLGIGMVVAVAPEDAVIAQQILCAKGHEPVIIGEVVAGSGQLTLVP